MRGNRKIIIEGGLCQIPLTKGLVAISDEADFPLIERGSWYAICNPSPYAVKYDPEKYLVCKDRSASIASMQRLILGSPEGMIVDHINGDTLDNRRVNLRVVTHAQNMRNRALGKNSTSGVIGVTWDSFEQRWSADIRMNGRNKRIGRYKVFDEAVSARKRAEAEIYGEYVRSI